MGRRRAQVLADLEGACLLPLYPERVYGIDHLYWIVPCYLFDYFEGLVEVALYLQHHHPVHYRLRELAHRDSSVRHEDKSLHAGLRRVGGRRSRGVAGGGAYYGL